MVSAPVCVGCGLLLVNPWTGSQLLQSGIYGFGGSSVLLTPSVLGGNLSDILVLTLNNTIAALIEMGDEEGARVILEGLFGTGDEKKDERAISSCR